MSIPTLYTAATGMESLQSKLDTIANNLANVNTTAFKRDRANFEDLFYRHEVMPGAQDSSGQLTPTGVFYGLGSRVASVQSDFGQGTFDLTGGQLDVAIEGNGFFQVRDPSGEIVYSRAGNFSKNATGDLTMGSAYLGRLLDPPINIPEDTEQGGITIGEDGIVSVRQSGSSTLTQVGTIQLAQFINPQGLLKIGENLYAVTDASGQATTGNPGTIGLGRLQQGALEQSNVEPVRELIDLITTQRAFELNSQAVQAGDQVLQLVANLRRF